MNVKSLTHAVLLLVAIGASHAHALPIVAGSSYDTALVDDVMGAVINTVTFDGVAETFGSVTINESQTAIGGGLFQVNVDFTSSSDVFPGGPRDLQHRWLV